MIAGDFNCVLHPDDKRGGRPFVENTRSRECQEFLNHNGLVDLGFVGPRFTLYNNRSRKARMWERIDKIFVTPTWIQWHPAHVVRNLSRIGSDHCPVLFIDGPIVSCHSPFRFEKFWLAYPRSWEIVRRCGGCRFGGMQDIVSLVDWSFLKGISNVGTRRKWITSSPGWRVLRSLSWISRSGR